MARALYRSSSGALSGAAAWLASELASLWLVASELPYNKVGVMELEDILCLGRSGESRARSNRAIYKRGTASDP